MILAVNKWDLVENKQENSPQKYEKMLQQEAPFLDYIPKIFISAVTKQRLVYIYQQAIEVHKEWTKRVSTSTLNKVISEAFAMNPPNSKRGKRLKILYTTQVKAEPPTFVMFVNNGDLLVDSYRRYLEKRLREAFGFFGTPIKLTERERKEKDS